MGFVAKPPQIATSAGVPVMADGVTNPSAPATQTAPVASSTGAMLAAMQSGSFAYKYVVAIEGYSYLLTDATPAAAVVAWGGSDWIRALPGLYVELDNQQSIDPWQPFQGGGKCTLRVQADDNDTFGIDTNRKADGAEALLRAAANRVGTPQGDLVKATSSPNVNAYLAVDNGSAFVAGDAFVGTECVELSASGDATRLNTSRRGKYSPFPSAGSGGRWFSQHHRVATDSNGVLLNPTASQQPRTWIGKWVGVFMHTVDGSGNLCSRADAVCAFAGTIVGVDDDAETGYTVIGLEHVLDTIKTTTIGRDMWSATITEGIYLVAGRTFSFTDYVDGVSKNANTLNVVASGAAGTNQINAGYYGLGDICSALNAWLSGEFSATRINGTYVWRSPVTAGTNAFRTKCYWKIANASALACGWKLDFPVEIAMFLGLVASSNNGGFDIFGSLTGATQSIGQAAVTNLDCRFESIDTPWKIVMMRGDKEQRDLVIYCENERGTAQDQYATLPSADKPSIAYTLDPTTQTSSTVDPTSLAWGVFLMDERFMFVASISVRSDATTLGNVRPMSFAAPGIVTGFGTYLYGRRCDDPNQGPTTIRQIFVIETKVATFVKQLFYSTGTTGYNHATYDVLPFGLGVGLPGSLLGSAFETSVDNLTNAQAPIAVVINESTALSDLIGADLVLRRAFPVWKNSGIRLGQWVTPTIGAAVLALTESNKAEPSGNVAGHRMATALDDRWVRNVVKIDFDRIFTLSKDGQYQSEIAFEDHVSVDDSSGKSKVATIKARNTYSQFLGTGAGIEALAPHFMATLPLFSRPARRGTRSIDSRYFEGYAPGDVALVYDNFMRDPATGARGVSARPAVITRLRYNPGGPTPGNPKEVTGAVGEAELFFLDLHRDATFSPSGQVDDGYPYSGFSAGYNATTLQLAILPYAYSERSEATDDSYFRVGDAIVVEEIDSTSPQSWRRTITANAGGLVTINQSLDGFSAAKRYRIVYDNAAQQQATQGGKAAFASATTGKILGRQAPYHLSATLEALVTTANGGELAELVPASAAVDGAPVDVGRERSLIRTLNAYIDGKSLHCSSSIAPFQINALNYPKVRCLISLSPIFLGREMLSQAALRYLYLAPLVRYAAAAASTINTIWATLSRTRPTVSSGWAPLTTYVVGYQDQAWTTSWEVTGTQAQGVAGPWYTLPIQFVPADVKGSDGLAWLSVESYGRVDFGGFAMCEEGARRT